VPLSFYFICAEKGLPKPTSDVLYFALHEMKEHPLREMKKHSLVPKDLPPVLERVDPYSFVASNH
jgi:hypothetical protein